MTQAVEHLDANMLSAYVDGELVGDEQQQVREHLYSCHACMAQVLSTMQLKAAVGSAGQRYTPIPEAFSRLSRGLRSRPMNRARILFFPPLSLAAIAALIIVAISVIGWPQLRQSNALAAELLDQHLATLASGGAPAVVSSDRHTVKPWFQGRISFSFNLPDPSSLPPDTTLRGANLVFIDRQPAAQLLFSIHKHQVSVFVTQRSKVFPDPLDSNRSGFSIRSANTPELRLISISDVNPVDLAALLDALVRAQAI